MPDPPFRLGMLIPGFPSQTHAFFWREIGALRAMGVEVHVLSTRRPREDCGHEWGEAAAAETAYLHPPRPLSVLVAMIAALPGLARALAYVGRLSGGPTRKARGLGFLITAMELRRIARARRLDHIHAHSCADAAHVVALGRMLGGPRYSLHLHGDLPVYGTDHAAKAWDAAFVAAAARPMERQLQEEVGLPATRTRTLWMGVDTDRFHPPQQKPAHPRGLHLVSIGRLNACKGHIHAFAALRQALDQGMRAHYTVGGTGPYEPQLRQAITQYRLEDHVTLVGGLSESGVMDLLHRADVFVLSSVRLGEASPVAVMEAMACGVPAVCSIIGGTPDMITDQVDGLLVPQEDEAGLTRAFLHLERNPDDRQRLARAARERAVQHFNYRETSRRLLETIQGKPQRETVPAGGAAAAAR